MTAVRAETAPAPLPGRVPLLGHLPALLRDPLAFLRTAQTHADVVTLYLGPAKAFLVTRPDHLHTVLVDKPGEFDKGVQFDKAAQVIGNSLPVAKGSFHRRQRKLIRPAFTQGRLAAYFEVMRDYTLDRIASWTPDTDLHVELRQLVGGITARTLYDVDGAEQATAELVGIVDILDPGVMRRVLDPTGLVEKLPLRSNRRFNRARVRSQELVASLIEGSRKAGANRQDLLSTLITARDETTGEPMAEEQLRDEAIAIMEAGFETTAQGLRWTCHELAEHPDVQDRVRREIDDVLGDHPLTMDLLGRLDYTRNVITEALRRHPPLFLLSRRPINDVVLGKHRIPAGSTVLISAYALHHDPARYPDPLRFDPDRWAGGYPVPERGAVTFLPFGAGLRSCLGERFAMMELVLVLAEMLRRWSLRRAPDVPVKPKISFVLAPSTNGTVLVPRSR